MTRRFNWQLWGGLLLTVIAFFSYFSFLVRYPLTRDVPWVPFLLLLGAVVLLVTGWRRAPRKIVASIVLVLGLAITALFTFSVTVGSKVPAAAGAPKVGEKAPEFTLPDTANRQVALSSLVAQSNGVLLIFYRGYW